MDVKFNGYTLYDMPKNIYSKREDLICGKLDLLIESVKSGDIVKSLDLIEFIRYDATRMEAKLIIRKQEANEENTQESARRRNY